MTERDASPRGRPNEPQVITSLTNDRIKAIRALEMRKERKETGLFVAEGTSILITAREMGYLPQTLVYRTGSVESGPARGLLDGALKAGVTCLEVSGAVLEKLSGKDNPQTMLAVYEQRWAAPPDPAKSGARDVWIVLEEVRDPGNLGTIVRTADAFGASGVILGGSCADPYSREAIRATMGSIFAVPIAKMTTEALLGLAGQWTTGKGKGDVVGTHLDGREDVRTADYRRPTLIVMGSEGPGLSPALTRACTRLVKIPMAGSLDSLNLAIATAITLFEVKKPDLRL